MTTFTSSLPDSLLQRLNDTAQKLKLPKNKLIEKALDIYLDQINRAEYVSSYKLAGQDQDTILIAEEGMVEYMTQLSDTDETR
ncbi:ribbon-helix-helix domain-containing protein [Gilvimarinus agarilyticus]|uniref:Ribbon-helix-helix domain-containing protein n=1 Tax=Reichenbachiella agariperforans TaxID=156994 RepID=A0A1M6LU85_REIAG|nr:ribbon-helix-helix domain-containing protein [Reichenbachiella agariperforans]MBU2884805.1 ribbon-helix-helix domain-containing protein [Gilvimarinus agarilyticus]MBU2914052.1 ribbon-helix-helix domain-containing protein [Reichenbachiella agariperforans]SHJ74729.1 Ribbon-helix-helix domain-containing protein [Reichenbachiella agariperforans]